MNVSLIFRSLIRVPLVAQISIKSISQIHLKVISPRSAELTLGPILRSYPVADKVQAVTHDEGVPAEDDDYDEARWRCIICGGSGQEDVLLLCDSCNDPYHTHCLDIDGIPEGEWFCPNCVHFPNRDTSRSFPAPGRRARTASRGRRAGRQSRRWLVQQEQWDRAWARMRDRTWEQLDADVREEESMGDVRGLTRRQEEERVRWMNRLSHSSNPGAAYLRATRSESGQSTRADTPPAAMSDPEEDRAWSLFEAAKSSVERAAKRARRTSSREDTPSSSRNATPRTPARSPPTQPRKLKRPRTRRVTPPPPDTPDFVQDHMVTPGSTSTRRPELDRRISVGAVESGGTFLQGLLSNINRPKSPETPIDLSTLTPIGRALLYGPSPPHSPSVLAMNSTTPESFPTLSDTGSPEPNPRHRSSSPSFAQKSHIQQLVSQALKPHYRSGQLTRDEFIDINKKICRKLYELVERGEEVDVMVPGEVEKEVTALKT